MLTTTQPLGFPTNATSRVSKAATHAYRSAARNATRPAGDAVSAATLIRSDRRCPSGRTPYNDLHVTVRGATQAVRGPDATGYPAKVPHLTTACARLVNDRESFQLVA